MSQVKHIRLKLFKIIGGKSPSFRQGMKAETFILLKKYVEEQQIA